LLFYIYINNISLTHKIKFLPSNDINELAQFNYLGFIPYLNGHLWSIKFTGAYNPIPISSPFISFVTVKALN
jgi:hypothetical protein